MMRYKKTKIICNLFFLIILSVSFQCSLEASTKSDLHTLAPNTYFTDPEDLIKNLMAKKPQGGPFEAIDKWMELHVNARATRRIYLGYRLDDPVKEEDRDVSYEISDLLKQAEDKLSERKWKSAHKDVLQAIELAHDYPLDYSQYTLDKVRRLYLWSYCMQGKNPKIPKAFWEFRRAIQSFYHPPSESGFTLAIVDINMLLWMEEYGLNDYKIVLDSSSMTAGEIDALMSKWRSKLIEWGELVGAPDPKYRRLQMDIESLFIRSDQPIRIYRWIKIGKKEEEVLVTDKGIFRDYPLDYIINIFYNIFDDVVRRQPFEDGNHHVGSVVLNYLLLIHQNALAIDVFTGNYQRGKGHLTHKHVKFFGKPQERMRMLYPEKAFDLDLAA